MKERLITLTLAVGALFLFYALFIPKPVPQTGRRSEPLSTDDGIDGQLAIWRWLQSEQVPAESLRYRYDHLLAKAGADIGRGNLLITVLPHKIAIGAAEADAISRWTAAGNTLLVVAALDDTPLWSLGIEQSLLPELKSLSGLTFTVIPEEAKAPNDARSAYDLLNGVELALEPRAEHPLLAQVRSVHGWSRFPASRWQANPGDEQPLILLQRHDGGAPALWLLRSGQGQVIVCSFASPFSNGQLDKDDNAQLLANIIRWSRVGSGSVIFDDMHQGLTGYYDPHAFFADPRLHRTLGWLLLLWLAFVLGPLPLRRAHSLWTPMDETALVDASGRFYAVAVGPLEAAHRLFENFFNALRRQLQLPQDGTPLWEWLRSQTQVSDDERTRLQELYTRVHAGQRIKLVRLQTLLADIQGKVA